MGKMGSLGNCEGMMPDGGGIKIKSHTHGAIK